MTLRLQLTCRSCGRVSHYSQDGSMEGVSGRTISLTQALNQEIGKIPLRVVQLHGLVTCILIKLEWHVEILQP